MVEGYRFCDTIMKSDIRLTCTVEINASKRLLIVTQTTAYPLDDMRTLATFNSTDGEQTAHVLEYMGDDGMIQFTIHAVPQRNQYIRYPYALTCGL